MKLYYFDNSATSNPKPEGVYSAVEYALRELNSNPGRGGHQLGIKTAVEIYKVREKIAKFFNVGNTLNVAFTNNSTTALNYAVNSIVDFNKNQIIITTDMEHNSVLRPLFTNNNNNNKDEKCSCEKTTIKVLKSEFFIQELNEFIKKNREEKSGDKTGKKIEALFINHMSNVTGKSIDLQEVGKICKTENIKLVVDASQSAGIIPIDMEKMNIDTLCFTGHKSLYGMQGIGGICIKEGIKIKPLICGGTGSHSTNLIHPQEMPEVVEAGTVNTPGIISLGAGVDFINSIGIEKIYLHENILKKLFLQELKRINRDGLVNIYAAIDENNGPVVSLNIKGLSSGELSQILDEEFGIVTRPGLHCAPLIHKENSTVDTGATRFSFGYFNTEDEIKYAVKSLDLILKELKKV